jgi:hypothetical protein
MTQLVRGTSYHYNFNKRMPNKEEDSTNATRRQLEGSSTLTVKVTTGDSKYAESPSEFKVYFDTQCEYKCMPTPGKRKEMFVTLPCASFGSLVHLTLAASGTDGWLVGT